MTDEKARPASWWYTLPGILTGIAAVLTAAGSIIVAVKSFMPASPPASSADATTHSQKAVSVTVAESRKDIPAAPTSTRASAAEQSEAKAAAGGPGTSAPGSIPANWEITQLPEASAKGKLLLKLPLYGGWEDIRVVRDGNAIIDGGSGSGDFTAEFVPGVYQVTFNKVPLGDLPIGSGKELKITLGGIDFGSTGGARSIYSADKSIRYINDSEAAVVTLPPGSYMVRVGEQFFPVTVKAGSSTKF